MVNCLSVSNFADRVGRAHKLMNLVSLYLENRLSSPHVFMDFIALDLVDGLSSAHVFVYLLSVKSIAVVVIHFLLIVKMSYEKSAAFLVSSIDLLALGLVRMIFPAETSRVLNPGANSRKTLILRIGSTEEFKGP